MEKLDLAGHERGNILISTLVALGLLGVAGKVMMSLFSNSSRSMKSIGIRADLLDIKKTIDSRLSCRDTLAPFGLTTPVNCSGPVTLLDANLAPVVPTTGKMAGWNITARCENLAGRNGISIYATKQKADGTYATDPLNNNMLLDQNSPVSMLYKPETRPCGGFFGAPSPISVCPNPSDTIVGIDLQTGVLQCAPSVTPNLADYVTRVVSPTWACGTGPQAVSSCPANWIAVSCGFQLMTWTSRSGSNAPDFSLPINTTQCAVRAGGRPGASTCFASIATCLNINKVANGH